MSKYGYNSISRDISKVLENPASPKSHKLEELPGSQTAKTILRFATKELPAKVLYHSLRVYQYSLAIIKDQFPQWELDPEVIFSTSLLHDIGATPRNLESTKMSFEFYGGIIARDLVKEKTGDKDYAEAVSEAIIRHQDLGTTGNITHLGFIIQVSTILDNVGQNSNLLHPDTLDAINKEYPREGWLGCFAEVIDSENRMKPWGHTSSLGVNEFRDSVLSNRVTYEKAKM